MPFVLGPALDMKAIPRGKAKHDTSDAHTIAALRRGGLLPQAYIYPPQLRATRDLLRHRPQLRRQRAAFLAHGEQPNRQYNLPESGKNIASKAKWDGVAERVADPAVQKSLAVDLALSTDDDQLLPERDLAIVNNAKPHDANTFYRLRSGPGVGKI